jgi:hypothetical protein
LGSVKPRTRPELGPVGERLAILLGVFSPWEGIALTYRQFAAELGKPVTEAAMKKWPQRKHFPAQAARLVVMRARDRGIGGVTLEWVLFGDGPGPQKAPTTTHTPSQTAWQEPHGRVPAAIAEALQADLSHNEFGQWSSIEVQRTVLWALKDLARRLRTLRFDMGQTFELTDDWAGNIGLPVRAAEQSSDEPSQTPSTHVGRSRTDE